MSTQEATVTYGRGDTVHNRQINKLGTVFEVAGDDLAVMTPSMGLVKWSKKDVDLIPDEPEY